MTKSLPIERAEPTENREISLRSDPDEVTLDARAAALPLVPPSDAAQSSPSPRSSRKKMTRGGGSSGQSSAAFAMPVEERYEILHVIGSGGMGRVFKALDHKLSRHVALKFLHDNQPGLIQRFFKEAQAQARIDHEYVCKIYEAGVIDVNYSCRSATTISAGPGHVLPRIPPPPPPAPPSGSCRHLRCSCRPSSRPITPSRPRHRSLAVLPGGDTAPGREAASVMRCPPRPSSASSPRCASSPPARARFLDRE